MAGYRRHGLVQQGKALKQVPNAIGFTEHQRMASMRPRQSDMGVAKARMQHRRHPSRFRKLYGLLEQVEGARAVDTCFAYAHSQDMFGGLAVVDAACLVIAVRQMLKPCIKTGSADMGHRLSEFTSTRLVAAMESQGTSLGKHLPDVVYGCALRGLPDAVRSSAIALSGVGVCELCTPEDVRKLAVAAGLSAAPEVLHRIAPEVELRVEEFSVSQLGSILMAFALCSTYPPLVFDTVHAHLLKVLVGDVGACDSVGVSWRALADLSYAYARYCPGDDGQAGAARAFPHGAPLSHILRFALAADLTAASGADVATMLWASAESRHVDGIDLRPLDKAAAMREHAPKDLPAVVWALLVRSGPLSDDVYAFLADVHIRTQGVPCSQRTEEHTAILALFHKKYSPTAHRA